MLRAAGEGSPASWAGAPGAHVELVRRRVAAGAMARAVAIEVLRAGAGVAPEVRGGPVAHVVVGALVRGGRVLMVHRSPYRRWYPDVWDLPGGHVEAGEDPRAALVRELREELAVEARVHGEPIARTVADTVVADVWAVHRWRGEPVNAAPQEHDALAWLGVGDLAGLELAHPGLAGQVPLALGGGRSARASG